MSEHHPRCPQCKGLLKYEPADILGPERVKCILCGWEKHRDKPIIDQSVTVTTVTIPVAKTEATVSETKRGNCPSCNREDVLMPGPKCSRCYDRIKRGVDVITGESTPVFRAHDHPTPVKAAATINNKVVSTNPEQVSKLPVDKMDSLENKLFSEDRDLFDLIIQAARRNRRTLAGEILYRLDQTIAEA